MLRVVCFGMPNTDWRQCDVHASAKGVRWHAALGRAHTRLPLSSATWAHLLHSESASGLPVDRRRREGHWQPTSVTALGGILVGDGRVAAGVSELGPAMSDGESGLVPSEL